MAGNAENPFARLSEFENEFAVKSTALSEMLIEVEDFLRSMNGKVAVEVELNEYPNNYVLKYSRVKGSEWELTIQKLPEPGSGQRPVCGPDGPRTVTKATIELKVIAAKLLPSLFEKMVAESKRKISEVDSAIETLESLPFLRGL